MSNKTSCCFQKCRRIKGGTDITVQIDHVEELESKVEIQRPIYTETSFENKYASKKYKGYEPISEIKKEINSHFGNGKNSLKKQIYNRMPCVKWLKDYRIREYFLADLLAGLIVGIMHIPQGMAYSLLASFPPVYGLYTSFFPVIIYWIFGSSRHNSMGTFAVVSLLTAAAISKYEGKYAPPVGFNSTINDQLKLENKTYIDTSNFLSTSNERARVLFAMSLTIWVGIIHCVMFIFQLGFITQYLSEPFIKSFTAGASIHVFTSQMKFIFGIKLTGYVGLFKIIKVGKILR